MFQDFGTMICGARVEEGCSQTRPVLTLIVEREGRRMKVRNSDICFSYRFFGELRLRNALQKKFRLRDKFKLAS